MAGVISLYISIFKCVISVHILIFIFISISVPSQSLHTILHKTFSKATGSDVILFDDVIIIVEMTSYK